MTNRRSVTVVDWINAVVLFVIGVILGNVAHAFMQLSPVLFLPMLIVAGLLFGGLVVFDTGIGRLTDWLFPSGIRPAHNPEPEPEPDARKPLAVLLGLPVGICAGGILARLGPGGFIPGAAA